MTTLVGIKANKGISGIIFGSDMSITHTDWREQGDVAYRTQTKFEYQKIHVDKERNLAVCMTGTVDDKYKDFLYALLEKEIDFEKSLKDGFFQELLNLNLNRWGGKFPNNDCISALLIATRYDEPKLYMCWPLGLIEERGWTSIGSGSDYAIQEIKRQGKTIPRGINLEEGIDLAIESLDKSSQDIYTGGLDIVVVTKSGIYEYGKTIKNYLNKAHTNAIKEIKKDLSKKV